MFEFNTFQSSCHITTVQFALDTFQKSSPMEEVDGGKLQKPGYLTQFISSKSPSPLKMSICSLKTERYKRKERRLDKDKTNSA